MTQTKWHTPEPSTPCPACESKRSFKSVEEIARDWIERALLAYQSPDVSIVEYEKVMATEIRGLIRMAITEEQDACIAACEAARPAWHDTGNGLIDEHNGGIDAAIAAIKVRRDS